MPTSRSVTTLGQLPAGTHPLRGIRRLTAASMAQSWTTIPHITGMDEVDATALLDARKRLQASLRAGGAEEAAAALTPLVLLAAAVARTLRRYPLVNAAVDADGASVTVHERVNLGVAVATPDGLIVPVVTDADRRDLVSLALEMQRLAVAARNRTVSADELRGGTFTLTNYGALGGRFATPLILPGQAGIMGFGAIKERPIVVDGAVVARRTLPVVFSADHRIIDGDLSVAFQEAVLGFVAEPLSLLLGA
ncbi:MAG: dihydrolipoamide acetyltransferase family protein [Acidimicrobiales bacterium]